MKIAFAVIIVIVFVAAIVALWAAILAKRRKPTVGLSPVEAEIRHVVRKVYAGNIVREHVERAGSDAVLVVELRNATVKDLQINLSSLARKHQQEGDSLPVLIMNLSLD
jgi:hypothetical protein